MTDSSTVWQVTLYGTGLMPRVLPYIFFSKSKALAYAIDKKKLLKYDSYIIANLTIGDDNGATELVSALQKALKEEEED